MKKIKIAVKDNATCLLSPIELISGTVGLLCTFYFDDDWKALPIKQVSFKIDTNIVGTYDLNADTIEVPPRILKSVGSILEIGVIGYAHDHQTIVLTSWCHIGEIKPGAMSGTPDVDDDDPETGSSVSEKEMLNFLMDANIVQPLSDINNLIYTDNNNKLYVL